MEWSDVRIFLAIARNGSLGAAAKQLGQSQPTMGRRLTALEESVGQILFQRTSKGFVLTDEGAAVLLHAERVEEEAIAFERTLAGKSQQLEGSLRVSSSDWFGLHILNPIFADFLKLNPKVDIEWISDNRLLSLSRREADLVFRILPFQEQDVIQKRIWAIAYGLYSSKKVPTLNKNGDGSNLITMDTANEDFPDVGWMKKHLSKANVIYRSNSRDAQAQMCREGLGFAVLPTCLGKQFKDLKKWPTKENPPNREVWMGYHRDLGKLTRLRALIDFAVDRIAASVK